MFSPELAPKRLRHSDPTDCPPAPRPDGSDLRSAERPVVFFANGIGDALLALPALRALGLTFGGKLTLICDRRDHHLLYHELPIWRIVAIPDLRIERPHLRRNST